MAINYAKYLLFFLSSMFVLLVFITEEPGLGLFIITCWIFLFLRDYYLEFRKPIEERSYDIIIASIGFMIGLADPMIAGAELEVILIGGVLGFTSSSILWVIIVYFIQHRYPHIEGDSDVEDDMYEDVG